MSTDRETTRLVRSWLEEGVTRLPDRVLDVVLDQVPTTPQRRSWWPARRSNTVSTYAKLIAAAAAVLVVAVVGYRFLPGNGGFGGQPTVAPTPTSSLLAHGDFAVVGAAVVLDATGGGSNVTGSMEVHQNQGDFTVALECERTINGFLWIGGAATEGASTSWAPKGTRAAIVLKPGSPVQAIFAFQMDSPRSASCQAFFDDMIAATGQSEIESAVEPIQGTVQLAP